MENTSDLIALGRVSGNSQFRFVAVAVQAKFSAAESVLLVLFTPESPNHISAKVGSRSPYKTGDNTRDLINAEDSRNAISSLSSDPGWQEFLIQQFVTLP